MYITRLHVKNLKLMRDLAFDFTYEGKPRMWTAFVAENGACKTTLLQAIALAASGPDRANQLADVPSLPDLRQPANAVRVGADFEFGTSLEKWRLFPETDSPLTGQYNQRLRSILDIGPDQSIFSGTSWFAPPETSGTISIENEARKRAYTEVAATLELLRQTTAGEKRWEWPTVILEAGLVSTLRVLLG
ncbi:MAG TPA: hypothetical protein VEZ71_28225, partial [Archangium sp.]|nr:hypothetical protein [Archangium sp.]